MKDPVLVVPDAALAYIEMHRTHLRGDLKALYAEDVARDYEMIRPHLPARAAATLDIGSGMAGIDVLLWRHYGDPVVNLLDGTGQTEVRVLFQQSMSPYNSMSVARRLLEANGVPAERIVEWPPDPALSLPPCDLVVSLLSWGFHFPVATYLPLVERCLRPGGRVILDVRKDTDGLEALDARLAPVTVVDSNAKADRVCYEKPA
jgi:SAM-dependent methyltransferase